MITFTVHGKPVAQARPRFVRRGKHIGTYNPQESEAGLFFLNVKSQLPLDWQPLEGPITLDMIFTLPIPSSKSNRVKTAMAAGEILPVSKPDLDNYVKFVCDALNGLLWQDDAQIVSITAHKAYGERTGTHFTVWCDTTLAERKIARPVAANAV